VVFCNVPRVVGALYSNVKFTELSSAQVFELV